MSPDFVFCYSHTHTHTCDGGGGGGGGGDDGDEMPLFFRRKSGSIILGETPVGTCSAIQAVFRFSFPLLRKRIDS